MTFSLDRFGFRAVEARAQFEAVLLSLLWETYALATKVLTLRLESDVFRDVCAFQAQHRIESASEAIRSLIDIALRDTKQLDEAFRLAAWRAGMRSGANKLREKMDKAVAECLGVTDGSAAG